MKKKSLVRADAKTTTVYYTLQRNMEAIGAILPAEIDSATLTDEAREILKLGKLTPEGKSA